jgi:hypothetical protein
VQIRLAPFDQTALLAVGRRVRALYAEGQPHEQRLCRVVDDRYLDTLARAVAGGLGGKVGVAPRLFLKKLIADILDRVDLHEDFDPRRHYTLTLAVREMSVIERAAASATSVDDIVARNFEAAVVRGVRQRFLHFGAIGSPPHSLERLGQ